MIEKIKSEQDNQIEDFLGKITRYTERRHRAGMPTSRLWLLGSDELTAAVVADACLKLGVSVASVLEVESDQVLSPEQYIADTIDALDPSEGKYVVLVFKHFEKVVSKHADFYKKNRVGHDWYQDIAESTLLRQVSNHGKHIVIFTTISASSGPEVYEAAVTSALAGKFHDTWLELP
ncbi:hypothetical protein KBC79_00650 [Candidatus Woesebacteria bacterium]|nr:hypothetical protein [Candidatus Woesebacteria bacterium]